jgi:hypothetical protein
VSIQNKILTTLHFTAYDDGLANSRGNILSSHGVDPSSRFDCRIPGNASVFASHFNPWRVPILREKISLGPWVAASR